MHSKTVELWHVLRSTKLDSDIRAAFHEEAIAHWIGQLDQALELISSHLSDTEASLTEASPDIIAALRRDSPLIDLNLYETVRVRAVVTFDETKPVHPANDSPLEKEYWPSILSFYLGNAFQIACLASHLARPGGLLFDPAKTFIDGQPIESFDGLFPLQMADDEASLSDTWPTLRTIDLLQVVSWLKSVEAFSPPIATTRLQRALASFAYLVGHRKLESEGEVLFRAMQGLESFYCDGVGDLRRQMSKKTSLWLGFGANPTNLVGKLYDLRSKYVHGAASMPYPVAFEDPYLHSPREMRQFYDGVLLATRLLVATLQKCICDEVMDIKWSYSYQTTSPGRRPVETI